MDDPGCQLVDPAVRRPPQGRRDRLAAGPCPNLVVIPGTSSVAHLRENLAAADLALADDALTALDGIVA